MRFRLLNETDVKAVLTMDDLIETMASALESFSAGRVDQPVRTVISIRAREVGAPEVDVRGGGAPGVDSDAFFGTMPALARDPAVLGAKLVTVFGSNAAKGLPSHLASILLLDPETGALRALLDGRYITEARTAAVSAVSSRLLARPTAKSLAIIGSGVQARSHLEALSRVHTLRQVLVWSPNKSHRDRFVSECKGSDPRQSGSGNVGGQTPDISAVDHPGEAVVGADVIALVTSSPTPVLESGWVKPGAHVISVGACRPTQREIDPTLIARARLFVDSRTAALMESGDIVMGIQEGRFGPDHIVAELGELIAAGTIAAAARAAGTQIGRRSDSEITIFKSLGMAVEDLAAADLALRRAVERGIGQELTL